jgi:hypothetical protein
LPPSPQLAVAYQFDAKCGVVMDVAVKGERRALLRQELMLTIVRRYKRLFAVDAAKRGKMRWNEFWLADVMTWRYGW